MHILMEMTEEEFIFHSSVNTLNISACLYIWLHCHCHCQATANIVITCLQISFMVLSSCWLQPFALAVITSRQQSFSPAARCPQRLLKPLLTNAICKWQQADEEIDSTAPKQWCCYVYDHRWNMFVPFGMCRWRKFPITGINVTWG